MDYFPFGLAGGAAFCNRESEREHFVVQYITRQTHFNYLSQEIR